MKLYYLSDMKKNEETLEKGNVVSIHSKNVTHETYFSHGAGSYDGHGPSDDALDDHKEAVKNVMGKHSLKFEHKGVEDSGDTWEHKVSVKGPKHEIEKYKNHSEDGDFST